MRKDENIYILHPRSLKCYYSNIASVSDLSVLCMNQREKYLWVNSVDINFKQIFAIS